MEIHKRLKKAMIDKNVEYALEVSELAGISYKKTLAVLSGASSAKLEDANKVALALGLNLQYIPLGE